MSLEEFLKNYSNTPLGDRKKYIKYGHRNISLLSLYVRVCKATTVIRYQKVKQKNLIELAEKFWKDLITPK